MVEEAQQALTQNQFDIGKINADTLDNVEQKKDTSGEELADLMKHPGYLQLEEYIKARIEILNNIEIDGMPPELIGYQYALHKGICDELKGIIDIVTANYEYQESKKSK